ncbi:hypothetical protein C8R46DRAFT_1184800 [Mycena filopes]|nr:hypothetical protein C8R46DRAFT_1184800 [Mycena filopes]
MNTEMPTDDDTVTQSTQTDEDEDEVHLVASPDRSALEAFLYTLLISHIELRRHLSKPIELSSIPNWPSAMNISVRSWINRGRHLFEAAVPIALQERMAGFATPNANALHLLSNVITAPGVTALLLQLMGVSEPRGPFDLPATFFIHFYHLGMKNPIEGGQPDPCAVIDWVAVNILDILVDVYGKAIGLVASHNTVPSRLPVEFSELKLNMSHGYIFTPEESQRPIKPLPKRISKTGR